MNNQMMDYGLDLTNLETYKTTSLKLIADKLKRFYSVKSIENISLSTIKKDINSINAFPGIMHMKEVSHEEIYYIEEGIDTSHSEKAILEGKIFFEHAAAGEATRLGIGTKYLIKPGDLNFDRIREILEIEAKNDNRHQSELDRIRSLKDDSLLKECKKLPQNLVQLSIGTRHMIQIIFDIRKLAMKHGMDPNTVIRKQKMLIILNEATSRQISTEIETNSFFSLDPKNVYFMEQKSFHGISKSAQNLFYDEKDQDGKSKDNRRLHNHGQMVMQKLSEESIFRLINGTKHFVSRNEFIKMMEECDDMISYNIEDLGYLTSSLDLDSLETALKLKTQGYKMVMEVVGQNPNKPQKGASLFKDISSNQKFMIESFRLSDIKPEQMKLMNKNFNHYPDPGYSLRKIAEKGLMLGFEIKTASDGKEYIYLCPVQGDTNFIVPTAYVTRKILKPIFNWKSASQTTQAISAMVNQEEQKGWIDFVKELKLI